MNKPLLKLQPSEMAVARSAASIYAAYITAGRVTEGTERDWMRRSVREAYQLARLADDMIQSDEEVA